MIRAFIFDFNGVIADDETPHLVCFQQALAEERLTLTKEEYYGEYLGMDERTCTRMLLTKRDGMYDEQQLRRIADRKAILFGAYTAHHTPPLFPGVVDFVKVAKKRYRLAIASGGRRAQIEAALAGTAIAHDFEVIVAAEDCVIGKPDPTIYRLTCERLNREHFPLISPPECVVLEDSVAGIRSAAAAGMHVVALATTSPVEKLWEAEHVFHGFQDITPHKVIDILNRTGSRSQF